MVALVPQHLAMIGTLNNDALCFLVVAVAVYQMVRILTWQGEVSRSAWAWLGVLVGIALITKTLAWIALPLAGLTVLLKLRSFSFATLTQHGATVGVVAALFIVPWFARNTLTYGAWDVMGLQQHDEIAVGQPRTEEQIAQRGVWGTFVNGAETTFHSFWGQYGWMKAPLQPREYQILLLFHAVALVGIVAGFAQRRLPLPSNLLLLFLVWIALNIGLLLYYNLEFVQYQGRYLFSALTPIAFFLMWGLGAWLPSRWRALPWGAFLLFLLYLDYVAVVERLPGMMNY